MSTVKVNTIQKYSGSTITIGESGDTITITSGATLSGSGASLTALDAGNISAGTLAIARGGTGSTSTTYASLTANVSGTLPIANGGTGSTSTTYASLTANVSGNLPVANLNSGTAASSSTFWRGDGTWVAPSGGVSLTGSTDNTVVTVTGADAIAGEAKLNFDGTRLTLGTATSVAGGGYTGFSQVTGANENVTQSLNTFKNDDSGPQFIFLKSRNATPGSNTIVADNDALGGITWAADDGVDYETQGANIIAKVDGTPGANDMPTELLFGTTPDGSNGVTANMKIRATGNVELTQNLVMASGKGIDFSATSDSSGTAESELLHDYEEGTFTPTMVPTTAGTTTYTTQAGYYVKIGKFVSITGACGWSAQTGSGQPRIAGLPYAISAQDSNYGGNGIGMTDLTLASSSYQAALVPQPSGAYANIHQVTSGSRSAAPHDASAFITIGMTYEATT